MCGIAGIIYKDKNHSVDPEILQRANNTLTHRGPDDSGYYINGHVGIAMRRLSIIDIVSGHQPISNETHQIHIVYNGELYNYSDLRNQLIANGHQFKTKSDTESILHAYEEFNTDLFTHLNGMFAFAIWDGKKQKMLIARDRLGIKPLFFYEDNEKFIFASEIKAILAFTEVNTSIDHTAIFDYLTFNYIPAPKSIYTEIKKLPPGHYITFEKNKTNVSQYWNYSYSANQNLNFKDTKDRLEELLLDSINIRLMSEVPLGSFLSGGIDSSTIAYFITKHQLKEELHTFSIGFDTDSKYDELPFSSIVADQLQTIHHTKVVHPGMVDLLPKVIHLFDEPMSDPSAIPTYLLSEFTRNYVTVALSGDGGDELFAGYERQKVLNILRRFYSLPNGFQNFVLNKLFAKSKAVEQKDSLLSSVFRIINDIKNGYSATFKRWLTNFNPQLMQAVLKDELYHEYLQYQVYGIVEECFGRTSDPINQSLDFETKYYLPDDLLVKVDRMSMGHSLEVRVPFLDHRLVEFAASLPVHYKIRGNRTKYILKEVMTQYLPGSIIKKPKQGFSPPIKEWLRVELKEYCLDILLADHLSGYIKKASLQKLLDEHYTYQRDYQYQIWSLLVFAVWLKNQ
ncbi:MAG: asparagine synthase (glutamine-hydrolyzing) [Candidatus Marinimicrobia bacterium]|nr:asparagine synthase (glutamine-hydrolyzing) [Candidatus Neomarinimicrobiota bacterium]